MFGWEKINLQNDCEKHHNDCEKHHNDCEKMCNDWEKISTIQYSLLRIPTYCLYIIAVFLLLKHFCAFLRSWVSPWLKQGARAGSVSSQLFTRVACYQNLLLPSEKKRCANGNGNGKGHVLIDDILSSWLVVCLWWLCCSQQHWNSPRVLLIHPLDIETQQFTNSSTQSKSNSIIFRL